MALIKYIGKKETCIDRVAGTGLIWENGGVQEVKDEKAVEVLLSFPDVWAPVEEVMEAKAKPRAKAKPKAKPKAEASFDDSYTVDND